MVIKIVTFLENMTKQELGISFAKLMLNLTSYLWSKLLFGRHPQLSLFNKFWNCARMFTMLSSIHWQNILCHHGKYSNSLKIPFHLILWEEIITSKHNITKHWIPILLQIEWNLLNQINKFRYLIKSYVSIQPLAENTDRNNDPFCSNGAVWYYFAKRLVRKRKVFVKHN